MPGSTALVSGASGWAAPAFETGVAVSRGSGHDEREAGRGGDACEGHAGGEGAEARGRGRPLRVELRAGRGRPERVGVHARSVVDRGFRSRYDGRGHPAAGAHQPSDARGQLTANRAPPASDVPTAHRPPVARTIASPIARPRPAPLASEDVESARWNRSKMRSRSCAGMPGPESSTTHRRAPALGRHRDVDGAALGRVLAGVVDEDADQAVDELGRGGDHDRRRGRVHPERDAARLGDRGEPVRGLGDEDPEVHRVRRPRRLGGVEPCQPEHVLEQAPHPLRLAVDAPEGVAIPAGVALLREREGRVRLDHREWRAELVAGVGRELDLPATGRLDRRGDPAPDDDRADEHRAEQERRDHAARRG